MRRRCQAHRVPRTCSPAPTIWAHASNPVRLREVERSTRSDDGRARFSISSWFFFKKKM
jgi:hypothetical protein